MKANNYVSFEKRKNYLLSKYSNPEDVEVLLKLWFQLSPTEFEYFVAFWLEKIWKLNTKVQWGYDDKGIDIVWERIVNWIKEYFFVQCKRWNAGYVWEKELKAFYWSTATHQFKLWARLFFVCTNELTINAIKYTDEVWIEYLDEKWVLEMYKEIDWKEFQIYLKEKMYSDKHDSRIKEKVQIKVSVNKNLFNLLKEVRYEISKTEGVPAYVVFKDETLKAISERKPLNKTQFLHINWVWEIKFEKYWRQFIEVIKRFQTQI